VAGRARLRKTATSRDLFAKLEDELKKKLQSRGMQFIAVDCAPFRARLGDMPKEFPELAAWVAKVQAVQ